MYLLYVDTINLAKDFPKLSSVVRWYIDDAHECSSEFTFNKKNESVAFCAFLITKVKRVMQLKNQEGVFATAVVYSACQKRWEGKKGPRLFTGKTIFVSPDDDQQVRMMRE
uniref:Uncharacterized protein n=1 Tax=Chromera velia CCMP2878 TaxID=1169474 RepID=A0A0G4HW93_9ALVE|eukprot:Cvel_1435.t1-p1 / transcript=Cvel_1435.t1 / gene=Cvel_1435 / organism=Chromera_velia_CCMP2878 / gene_product=hypothetical protein / transcript_product=hypothetical protein / location=Cvel_scaffold50:69525-71660(+) / protein_length=110 / sequence_SO=supercontig / SO=protein_coding / is_pseudo=false